MCCALYPLTPASTRTDGVLVLIRTILPNSRQRDHFAGILERVGERPDAEDHEALSFWAV